MVTGVISAANIRVVKGKKEILQVGELTLHKGEILSVLGHNGAGKSTLLLVLALLMQPASGQISFMGETVSGRNALSFRRRMAVVFQEPLLLNTTVYNNVAQGLKFRGVPRQEISRRVEFWLDKMGISHLAGRTNRYLSGGEAQRVNLARALVLQPEVLFLDEPFTALDFSTKSELIGEISRIIRENGITTFFVTHDYSEIPYFNGRAAVIRDGRLVYQGPADALLKEESGGVARLPAFVAGRS